MIVEVVSNISYQIDFKMDAKGVTPIPAPIQTQTE